MWNKQFNRFIGCESEYEDAVTVLFSAPFDGTTSFRPGTRFAGKAIRSESFGIETYSPYQDKDLADYNIFDAGDLDFPFGNPAKVLEIIEATTLQILNDGKIPAMIGGEHLVSLGAVRAAVKTFPDLCIIHLDAHADLRDDYLGEKFSHATVMRRIYDLTGKGRIYQFGIRSGDKAEFEFAAENTVMEKFALNSIDDVVKKLQGIPVYLTIDLDVLDPSIFSGTGTPEAGGVTFKELLDAIFKLGSLDIKAFDINELAPDYDHSGVSTATACKVLRELLIITGEK